MEPFDKSLFRVAFGVLLGFGLIGIGVFVAVRYSELNKAIAIVLILVGNLLLAGASVEILERIQRSFG